MLNPEYSGAFRKDVARIARRGKDVTKLMSVMFMLLAEIPLPPSCEDHALKGAYAGHRDCHVEPDLILIYRKSATDVRTCLLSQW